MTSKPLMNGSNSEDIAITHRGVVLSSDGCAVMVRTGTARATRGGCEIMSRYVDMDKCPCNNGGACEADCVFDKTCKRYEDWYSGEDVQPVIHCADCGFYEKLDGVMVCNIW